MYKVIAFDWDGTLYDSSSYIVEVFQWAANRFGLRQPQAEDIHPYVGLSLHNVVQNVFPELKSDELNHFIDTFYKVQNDADFSHPVLFSGTENVLKELKEAGYWLTVATGKSHRVLVENMKELGVVDQFLTYRSAEQTQCKPHPQMLHEIMDELGVLPEEMLMVGDTSYDLEMAHNAKVDSLAVSYGMHPLDSLLTCNPKGHINAITELPAWLSNSNSGLRIED